MKNLRFLFLTLSFFCSVSVVSANDRIPWKMDESYQGPYQDTYDKLRWDVPNFIRQATIEMAIRIGLDFQEGWSRPLIVQFVDSPPLGAENALAWVQLTVQEGKIFQTLNINLPAYQKDPFNFRKVFSHELVHAMLNDAIGGDAATEIPLWFHEGLAVYGAEQGEQMLTSYVVQNKTETTTFFINGLEGAHGALDYVEDYLAFDYIYQNHGSASLQNFIREVVSRKGDIANALEYTCSENWTEFQNNLKKYSAERIKSIKREPRFRGPADKPY
jgi:hypothetical protein